MKPELVTASGITFGAYDPSLPTLWLPEPIFQTLKRQAARIRRWIDGRMAMGAMTDYEEQQYLNHRFKGAALGTTPATWYLGLMTASAGESTAGTEATGGSYARQGIANANFTAPTVGEPTTIDNSAIVTFPTATADWGTILAATVNDAVTAGNKVYFGTLTASKVVANGDTFKFNANQFKIGVG